MTLGDYVLIGLNLLSLAWNVGTMMKLDDIEKRLKR